MSPHSATTRRAPGLAAVATILVAGFALHAAQPSPSALDIRARYTKYEHMVPMRDGVKLFTSVYVPKDGGPYPILLNRTPYSVAPYGADVYRTSLGPSDLLASDGSGGASPYGALDMSGNVWEFVADYYSEDYYANIPDVNLSGPAGGAFRVFRGGSWASELDSELLLITTFYRLTNFDYISSDVLGFRCASSQ